MDNNEFLNLIKEIYNFDGDFVLNKIANLIAEKSKTNISNCLILWDNQVNDQFEPLIYQEDIKGKFPVDFYFTNNIFKLTDSIGPTSGYNIKLACKDIFKSNIAAIQSICLLPIENKFNRSKAIVVFLSFNKEKDIGFIGEQIILLQKIIQELFNSKSTYLNKQFETLLVLRLTDFSRKREESGSLSEKYDELSMALEPFKAHICHYSIWKIDNLSKVNYKIVKEKYQNFKKAILQNGHFLLNGNDNHLAANYIRDFIRNQINESIISKDEYSVDFSQYILSQFYKHEDNPTSCLTMDYCNNVGIKDGETIILCVPIIPSKNPKYDSINVLCLYINNIHLTIFRSTDLLSLMSNKIYETFTLHNKIITNQTTDEILKASVDLADLEENAFYTEVIKIFKKKNECKNCFIYFRNNLTDSFDLKSLKQYSTKDIHIKDFDIPIPIELECHNNFMLFLKDYLENNISSKNPGPKNNIYYGEDEIVKSALILPIFNQEKKQNELTCFALFINKNIESEGSEKNSPFFLIHNEKIIKPSLEYINKYHQFKEAANNKGTLLKRIRHEIPNEVNLIRQNAEIIKDFFSQSNVQSFGLGNNRHFLNVIDQLSLSNVRIELFASFATTVGFSNQKIKSKMEKLNLSVFLSSMIDIFKVDARSHGVYVRFTDSEKPVILHVSQLYKLSIINLITNAIRYSRFGTSILIKVTENSIFVEDIGIPIPKEDDNKIYKENYRGDMARMYNQDGLGYGLFLAKKIIEAHEWHKLNHTSELDSKENLYGIAAMYSLLTSNLISFSQKIKIYNSQLEEEDMHTKEEFIREVNRLGSYINDDPNPYLQIDSETTKLWILNKFNLEKIMYEDFLNLYLFVNTYKTVFTIHF